MSSSNYFNGYNFVINSFILEKIHSYNLSLNEFLLLMYFLNIDDREFVLNDLKKYLKLSKEEVLSSLNILIEKGIVTLETKKEDDGVIREYISLSKFFDLLDHNDNALTDDLTTIIEYLKNNCKTIASSADIEFIKEWLNRGFKKDTIIKCIDESIYNGSFDIRYVDNLLYKSESKVEDNKSKEPLFDYDWLDDEKK